MYRYLRSFLRGMMKADTSIFLEADTGCERICEGV